MEAWKGPDTLRAGGGAPESEDKLSSSVAKAMPEIKASIHRKLLERLNLANLDSVDREEAKGESAPRGYGRKGLRETARHPLLFAYPDWMRL